MTKNLILIISFIFLVACITPKESKSQYPTMSQEEINESIQEDLQWLREHPEDDVFGIININNAVGRTTIQLSPIE